MLEAWLARLRAPGEGLNPVAVVVNQAISVGEARWSVSLRTASVPDSSATLSPVPPCSSSTLSAGASRQLLYTLSWSV